MNLETQIRQVRSRFAEPRTADPADDRFTDTEILEWIHQAEIHVIRNIAEREKWIRTATFPAVNGQELYDRATAGFPTDLIDIVRVTYASAPCIRHPVHEIDALEMNSRRFPRKGYNQYFYELAGTFGTSKLGIRPIPNDATNIVLWYIKMPYRRYKHKRGTTTAAGTNVEIIDATNLTHPNNFWTDSEVRLFDGVLAGQERIVASSTKATTRLTVSTAFDEIVAQNVIFEVGEVSELSKELDPLVTAWATYLAKMKNADPDASAVKIEFKELLAEHNSRYGTARTEPGTVAGNVQ